MCLQRKDERAFYTLYLYFLNGLIIFFASDVLALISPRQLRWPHGIISQMQSNSNTWFITAQDGFFIRDVYDPHKGRMMHTKTMIITHCAGGIAVNGIPIAQKALIIMPRTSALVINGVPYKGMVRVVYRSGVIGLQVIGSRYGNKQEKQKLHSLEKIVESFRDSSQQLLSSISKSLQSTFDAVDQSELRTFGVRVLLSEWNNEREGSWSFYSPQGFIISNLESKKKRYKNSELIILIKKGNLYIDGAYCGSSSLCLTSVDGNVSFNGSTYHGSFIIKQGGTIVQCINYLDVENYIFSVLRTESWPGWPIEVNKVFAIVSRSYVVEAAMRARKKKRSYDVKNTNEHQTYNGIHTSSIIKQAVDETKGVLLGFDNEPILAMYDSCCGGVIPAYIEDFNFSVAPYLAREYACTHCKNCNIYAWKVSYERKIFERLIGCKTKAFDRLRAVKITKKDKAGLVSEVTFRGAKKWKKLSGKKVYSLLKEIKSFCFSVRKKGDKITFKGRGFGHHLGLCQWGAREMVRDGWDYKQILQFYYPDTRLMYLI